MELTFRNPAKETRQAMCDASREMGNRLRTKEYRESAEESIEKITGHETTPGY